VTFDSPNLDGGQDVTMYKIEYANTAFITEVQEVDAVCAVTNEVQIIKTDTSHNIEEVQLIYLFTNYASSSLNEIQEVVCDASGGSFRLSFSGYTTQSISWEAGTAEIKAALEQLAIINSVSVTSRVE